MEGGTNRVKLDESSRVEVKELMREDRGITINIIENRCLRQPEVSVTKSKTIECFKTLSYNLKEVHLIPGKRNWGAAILKLLQFLPLFFTLQATKNDSKF
ncbi:hypothetical protein HZS_668 [Henneguya salminicola]|nr:hypothetical protein HZS_668 [Henneguya salminicola]